jgi:hypothetical protein
MMKWTECSYIFTVAVIRMNSMAVNRPDHDQQHCYHHAPKVKPEVATAVVELLMMAVAGPTTTNSTAITTLRR